jgi:hypothetical protein
MRTVHRMLGVTAVVPGEVGADDPQVGDQLRDDHEAERLPPVEREEAELRSPHVDGLEAQLPPPGLAFP